MTVSTPKAARPRESQKAVQVRVAIYTRKSVTEGLDQAFNTLDAQREAAESYVDSQRSQGWLTLSGRYDDGGYSGATTDRPAFQKLMADVEAGKVDVIAVYRLDRLSRSLVDFANLMRFLQENEVAFVSVTERFDTSTPMGRMVLNLLATFAQFERETIALRTRDKIAASRRRGMWTGGRPVLGYDVVDKRLVIKEEEAEQVRALFGLYLELGSTLGVAKAANARGWTLKRWTNAHGRPAGGARFTKTSLQGLLRNPLYNGMVRSDDDLYEGEHEGIVDRETWDAVQALLSENRTPGKRPARHRSDALLAGLVLCRCGATMTYHYTSKGPKRYRYIVCSQQQKLGAARCPGSRVAAGRLESAVEEQIMEIGRSPAILRATVEAERVRRRERRPALEAEATSLRSIVSKLEREVRNVTEAVAADGRDSALLQRLGGATADVEIHRSQLARVNDELAAQEEGQVDPEVVASALKDLGAVLKRLSPVERARLIALIVEQVRYDADEGEMEITLRPNGIAGIARGGLT